MLGTSFFLIVRWGDGLCKYKVTSIPSHWTVNIDGVNFKDHLNVHCKRWDAIDAIYILGTKLTFH